MQIILLLLAMFGLKDLSAAEASTSSTSRLLVDQLKQAFAAKVAASAKKTTVTPARANSITTQSSTADTRASRKRQADDSQSATAVLPSPNMSNPHDIFISDVSNLLQKLSPSTSTESRTRMAQYISETLVPAESLPVVSSKRLRKEGSLVQQNAAKNNSGDQSVASTSQSTLVRTNRDELLRSDLITLLLQLTPTMDESSCSRIADHAVTEVVRKEKENKRLEDFKHKLSTLQNSLIDTNIRITAYREVTYRSFICKTGVLKCGGKEFVSVNSFLNEVQSLLFSQKWGRPVAHNSDTSSNRNAAIKLDVSVIAESWVAFLDSLLNEFPKVTDIKNDLEKQGTAKQLEMVSVKCRILHSLCELLREEAMDKHFDLLYCEVVQELFDSVKKA